MIEIVYNGSRLQRWENTMLRSSKALGALAGIILACSSYAAKAESAKPSFDLTTLTQLSEPAFPVDADGHWVSEVRKCIMAANIARQHGLRYVAAYLIQEKEVLVRWPQKPETNQQFECLMAPDM